MSRSYFVQGETLIRVKGNVNTGISALTDLGLTSEPIRVTPNFRHKDIEVDVWGRMVPPDVQAFLADVTIRMSLVHFDRNVVEICQAESLGGSQAALGNAGNLSLNAGWMQRAGALLGGNSARFAANNHFIGLNLLNGVGAGISGTVNPIRFLFAYMDGPAVEFPLGTEKSILVMTWRAIPYSADPWNGGAGALGSPLWDFVLDT